MTNFDIQKFTAELNDLADQIDAGEIPAMSDAEIITALISYSAGLLELEKLAPNLPISFGMQIKKVIAQIMVMRDIRKLEAGSKDRVVH